MKATILSTLRAFVLLLVAANLALAQAPQAGSEGKATRDYAAEEVGWKTRFPSNWKAITAEERAKLDAAGKKAIEKATGGAPDTSGVKELLSIRKDEVNAFLATAEPYDEAADGPYADTQKKILETMIEAYKDSGVKVGKTASGKATIDGLEFYTIECELLHPTTGVPLMQQKLYSRLINGFDFSMTISSNNDQDRKVMEAIVTASKFSKRK